jgi:hypothetical protein
VLPPSVTPTRERSSADPGVDMHLALALAVSAKPSVCPCLPRAPRRRRPRYLLFCFSHSQRNPARPDPPPRSIPAARRARSRNGPHHDLSHVKNGMPPQKDGTLATRDLRIDERTDVVLVADRVRPVSAPSLRRQRPHAHLAQDTFFRLQPSMSFDPQD